MRITTCLQAEGAGEAGTLTKTSSTLRNPHLRWTAEIARQAFVSPPGMTDRFERKADLVYGLYGVEGGPHTNNYSAIKPS